MFIRMIGTNLRWVLENIQDFTIPENFQVVAPIHDGNDPPQSRKQRTLPPTPHQIKTG